MALYMAFIEARRSLKKHYIWDGIHEDPEKSTWFEVISWYR